MAEMTSPTVFHFDDSFQQGLFALMLKDPDFCYKCAISLKPEFFANAYYAKIFDTIKILSDSFEGNVNPMMVYNELLKLPVDDKPPHLNIFKKIIDPSAVRNFDYIRQQLEQFVKRSVVWQLNSKLLASKANDPETLYQIAMKSFKEVESVTFQEDSTITLKNLMLTLERNAAQTGKLLPTGLPNIDKALGGGLPKGTLTTAIGGTNVGKSIFLHNLASEWIMAGYKVLLINLEGIAEQPLLRMVSRSTGIQYAKLRFNQLSSDDRVRIKRFEDENVDRLQIKHVHEFNYSVEDLFAYAKDKMGKWKYDALVVDYGQLLGTKSKQEGLRHSQAYVHRALASAAVALDVVCVTVAQGTRDTQDKNSKGSALTRMNDISECFEINRVSAQVMTINRSEQDEKNHRCRILLDKQREGQKGVVDICVTDFSCIALYGPATRGLGFISNDQYITEEFSDLEIPGKPLVSEGVS